MKELTLREAIVEGLVEAKILECAHIRFNVERMLLTAMRLSGAPYSFVQTVYDEA